MPSCPKCGHWVREEQRYMMQRDKNAELSPAMILLGKVGLVILFTLVLAFLIHLTGTIVA